MDSRYIVSDEYKFVYFVVPKAACTSIKAALLPLFDLDPSPYRMSQDDAGSAIRVHKLFADSDYQIYEKQFLPKPERVKYDDYFKFAFVRNPWDRIVSCWVHKLSNGNRPSGIKSPPKLAEKLYGGMPFSEFVEVVADTPDSRANLHFKSQSSIIYGGSNEKSPLTDSIGRFENLREDFDVVAEKIGAKEKLQLGHLMRSSKGARPYTDFYDKRLRDLVYERFQEDVENFGYSF